MPWVIVEGYILTWGVRVHNFLPTTRSELPKYPIPINVDMNELGLLF
jgi:hypothetical protein